jgi:hypothetical protein
MRIDDTGQGCQRRRIELPPRSGEFWRDGGNEAIFYSDISELRVSQDQVRHATPL